jgi:tetratricopeptide (TPR) repeat protein
MDQPDSPIGAVYVRGAGVVSGPAVGANFGTINYFGPGSAPLHQLRAPLATFVGREAELAAVLAALRPGAQPAAAPAVAICGMGGLGKTELAIRAAHALAADYPDAQLVVELRASDLGPARTAADGLRDVIRTFDRFAALPDDVDALAALYRGHLSGRRGLVLVDDAPDLASVRPFLPPAGCTLIVTSRTRLRIAGLLACITPGLFAREESWQVLRAAAPDVRDEQGLDRLLGYCGDLPLAVQVVASTLAEDETATPEELVSRLGDEQQRRRKLSNVRAVLSVSDRLLERADPALARRWRMLAACGAPFAAAVAAAIWDEPDLSEVEDSLARLLKRSLLFYDRATRLYRMHDLLREVAREHQPAADEHTARVRHATHFLALAREADRLFAQGGEQARAGLALFDGAWLHIRAAAAWVAATPLPETDVLCVDQAERGSILELRAQPRELVVWYSASAAAARRLGRARDEAYALLALGNGLLLSGDVAAAAEPLKKGLATLRQQHEPHGEALALHLLGQAAYARGQWPEAERDYRAALALAEQSGAAQTAARSRDSLGVLLAYTQSFDEAIRVLSEARAAFEALGDQIGRARTLDHLSDVYVQASRYDRALECAETLRAIAEEHGDAIRIGEAHHTMGIVHWQAGRYDAALAALRQSVTTMSQIGYRPGAVAPKSDLAGVHAEQGDYAEAMRALGSALEDATATGNIQALGLIVGNAGEVYRLQGEDTRALACFTRALAITLDLNDRPGTPPLLGNIALVLARGGEREQAARILRRAAALDRDLGVAYGLCDDLFHLALLAEEQGHPVEAARLSREALAVAREAGRRDIELEALLLAARLRPERGAAAKATEALLEVWQAPHEQAAIHFQLWRLDTERAASQAAAAEAYRRLHERTPNVGYRERYQELTGEALPVPAPLPSLPEDVLGPTPPLDALLARAGVTR